MQGGFEMNISEIIKQKREEKGLSVEELSSQTMLSVAIIRDIENGDFDHYQGEEAYVKMYLRKICRALDINEKEVQNEYLNLTQKIELEELQEAEAQSEVAKKKQSADEEKAKAFRFEKPSFTNSNKGVMGNKSHLNVIRVIIIVLLVAMIFCVGFFAISKTKSKANVPSFTSNQQTAAGEVTKKPSKKKGKTTPKKDETPAVTYTRNSDLNYNFKLKDANAETFKLKVEYSKKCWGSLYVNRAKYTEFEGKVYNEGDTVELTLNTADFNTLRLVSGEQSGVKVYVDDVEVPLTDEEKAESGLKYTYLTLEK